MRNRINGGLPTSTYIPIDSYVLIQYIHIYYIYIYILVTEPTGDDNDPPHHKIYTTICICIYDVSIAKGITEWGCA